MPELVVATVTPFTAAGHVDLPRVAAHARFLVDAGVHGLAPVGTTGEFLYLSREEKRAVNLAVIEAVAGRARVVCGVWDPDLGAAAALAAEVAAAGADAVFLPPPLFHVVPAETVVRWYGAIRDAVSVDLLAYHHPRTHNPIDAALLERLLREVGVDGFKDSSGDPERVRALATAHPGRVWAGGDRLLGDHAALGPYAGHISGYANWRPERAVPLFAGLASEAHQAARARVLADLTALKRGGSTSVVIKELLGMGHRMPLDGVDREAVAAVREATRP